MSTGNGNNKKTRNGWKGLLALVLVIILSLFGISESNPELWQEIIQYISQEETIEPETNNQTGSVLPVEGTLEMHVIDVGQGDCILIRQGEHAMLVDCGEPECADVVIKYLKDHGIDYLDFFVCTHVHSDHMGAAGSIIKAVRIGVVYTPDDSNTTLYYEDFMQAVLDNNLTWKFPEMGQVTQLGDARIQFIAPSLQSYSNTNNYSIGIIVSFGEVDIVLTGDAEKKAEKEMIETGLLKDVEVFKAGHHGSDTSNTQEFLEVIKPEYVVISAGFGNKHDHPIKSVMERFKEMGIIVLRTDESGTIVMNTDGKNITWNVEPGDYLSGEELVQERGK